MTKELQNLGVVQFLSRVFGATESPWEAATVMIMFIVSLSVVALLVQKIVRRFDIQFPLTAILYPLLMVFVSFGLTTLFSLFLQPFESLHSVLFGSLDESSLPFTIQGLMWTIFFFFIIHAVKKYLVIKRAASEKTSSEFVKQVSGLSYMSTSFSYLGMFGTVFGISQGLFLFNEIEDLLTDLNGPLLMEIVAQLGTAFHTTMLGIAMTLVSVFILNRMDKRFGSGQFA